MLKDREKSPDMSLLDTPKTPGNVFEESQVGRLCKNFVNCLRNLEKKVKDIHDWHFPVTTIKLKVKNS